MDSQNQKNKILEVSLRRSSLEIPALGHKKVNSQTLTRNPLETMQFGNTSRYRCVLYLLIKKYKFNNDIIIKNEIRILLYIERKYSKCSYKRLKNLPLLYNLHSTLSVEARVYIFLDVHPGRNTLRRRPQTF